MKKATAIKRCRYLNKRYRSSRRIGIAWAGIGECLVKLNNLPRAEESLRHAADLSHEPRVIEQWQHLRAMMGLAPAPMK